MGKKSMNSTLGFLPTRLKPILLHKEKEGVLTPLK
jgi:hypothetical protein